MDTRNALEWLAERWATGLEGCIGTMLPDPSGVQCRIAPAGEMETAGWIWWTQTLNGFAGQAIRAGAAPDAWNTLARTVLEAVGVEGASDDDIHGTCRDLIAQSGTALARDLAARCGSDGNSGDAAPSDPDGGEIHAVLRIAFTGTAAEIELGLRFHQQLADAVAAAEAAEAEAAGPALEMPPALAAIRLQSHVTLGRTTMLLKDVFKMTAGSIIELRQLVTDAADLVANGKTVARGQIVILNGDYALKVTSVARGFEC